MKNTEYKKKVYNLLNIEDSTIKTWSNNDYSMDLKVSLEFQGYLEKADKIKIIGDYDCDGIFASHIMDCSISSLYPNKEIEILIPTRSEGYGINERIVNRCIEEGKDNKVLVITVDTGIIAKEYLEQIKNSGCDVIITDHHECKNKELLPNVDMIINPSITFIDNPLNGRNWCGAAIAYKIIENLVNPQMRDYCICFAGIATIADVIEMREGSWQLTRNALNTIKKDCPYNLRLLLSALNRDIFHLREDDIGFYLAPCINAPGRLEQKDIDPKLSGSSIILDFLDRPNTEKAIKIKELNDKRKEIRDEELALVKEDIINNHKENNYPIWVYIPNLHEGILGLLAGNIKEEYGVPVCICTNTEQGTIKGSSRSIDEFNIYDYFFNNNDLFIKWGGHEKATGFELTIDNYNNISSKYEIREKQENKENYITIELNDIPTINKIVDNLRPFGEGFPEPIFKSNVDLDKQQYKMIGSEKNHLSITNDTPKWKVTHFRHTESHLNNPKKFNIYGSVHENYFLGKCTPELNVQKVDDDESKEHEELGLSL